MEENSLILTLKERAVSALEAANSYLATFNGDGILVLFENVADKKKYLERYSAFSLKLNDILSLFENSVADLSNYICKLEETGRIEAATTLCPIFEECEALIASITKFVAANEKNFKGKESFSPTHSLSSARELKMAIQTFSERING